MAGMELVVPPAIEPVSLLEIKAQLKIDPDDESYDDQVEPLIIAAREWCEDHQERAYITQTWELALDAWPCGNIIKLPRAKLQEVESVEYVDDGGTVTSWDGVNYIIDRYSKPGKIVRHLNTRWPHVKLAAANGIIIRYVAGYGDSADDVPEKIKQAIILLVCHWFENGYCEPPCAVRSLLAYDKIVSIG